MTLEEFLRTVWRGRYYVVGGIVIVVVAALYYLTQQDSEYRATSQINLTSIDTAAGGEKLIKATVEVDFDDIKSEAVATAAAETLGQPNAGPSLATRVSAYKGENDTINVAAKSDSPEDAVDAANAFAAAYVTQIGVRQSEEIAALEKRRQTLESQLRQVEQRLGPNNDNVLAGADQKLIVTEYTSLTIQLNTLRAITEPATLGTPATGADALGISTSAVLAMALLGGLLAGIGFAFARPGLDIRVRGAADAAQLSETPVLAEIHAAAAAHSTFRKTAALPVTTKAATPFTESIRELRTAVQVSMSDARQSVVVVTAADRHGHRAFITANLASSFALSGLRTIAVSGDLRQPQLDQLLAPTGEWDGEVGLRPAGVPNLSVYALPDEQMDPADYLATAQVRDLINELRQQCDVLVIDAPPALAAADASILGRYATEVVLVATTGRTDRSVLTRAAHRLMTNNVPLAGIALAGAAVDRRMVYASSYGESEAIPAEEHKHARTDAAILSPEVDDDPEQPLSEAEASDATEANVVDDGTADVVEAETIQDPVDAVSDR